MPIPDPLKQQIITHCQTAAPYEACGFVILDYQTNEPIFLPCENVALDPENYFEIVPDDFVRAELQGEIVAVVHSHPDNRFPQDYAEPEDKYYGWVNPYLFTGGKVKEITEQTHA